MKWDDDPGLETQFKVAMALIAAAFITLLIVVRGWTL